MTHKGKSVARKRISATDVDAYVGQRIRERRIMLGMTQQQLSGKVGVTYQQQHKREHGINRISASHLFATARALGVEVGYFFDGMDSGGAAFRATGHKAGYEEGRIAGYDGGRREGYERAMNELLAFAKAHLASGGVEVAGLADQNDPESAKNGPDEKVRLIDCQPPYLQKAFAYLRKNPGATAAQAAPTIGSGAFYTLARLGLAEKRGSQFWAAPSGPEAEFDARLATINAEFDARLATINANATKPKRARAQKPDA